MHLCQMWMKKQSVFSTAENETLRIPRVLRMRQIFGHISILLSLCIFMLIQPNADLVSVTGVPELGRVHDADLLLHLLLPALLLHHELPLLPLHPGLPPPPPHLRSRNGSCASQLTERQNVVFTECEQKRWVRGRIRAIEITTDVEHKLLYEFRF